MDAEQRAQLLLRLRHDGSRIARHFGLQYKSIAAERQNVKSRYGHCTSDGVIKIRLNHAKTGKPLKYSSLVDTLCHELAHLKHFDHSPSFRDFFWEVLSWARQEGIYQPRRRDGKPAADGKAGANAPMPMIAARPQRLHVRNGVPVFVTPQRPELADDDGLAPWERWAEALNIQTGQKKGRRSGGRPNRPRPTTTPNTPSNPATPSQTQLTLF